jgi:hypothetical protein
MNWSLNFNILNQILTASRNAEHRTAVGKVAEIDAGTARLAKNNYELTFAIKLSTVHHGECAVILWYC